MPFQQVVRTGLYCPLKGNTHTHTHTHTHTKWTTVPTPERGGGLWPCYMSMTLDLCTRKNAAGHVHSSPHPHPRPPPAFFFFFIGGGGGGQIEELSLRGDLGSICVKFVIQLVLCPCLEPINRMEVLTSACPSPSHIVIIYGAAFLTGAIRNSKGTNSSKNLALMFLPV